MNFNAPLYAPQYAKIRAKSYAGTRLVSLFEDEVVFAGQVNSDLTTPQSWAEFAYNNITVGSYTDAEYLFTIYIGTANDIKLATFEGYCRIDADASFVYCNESSQDFVVGAYFWVIRRINIKYVQSRPSTNDPTTAVELVNYDQTYQGLLPLVQGLRTGYVGYVNPNTGYLRLAFDVSSTIAAESGATISSYLYDIAGASVVAGSLSEAIVVVDIPYGQLYGKCTVTDTGGRAKIRRFAIKAHDPVYYPPNTSFEGGSISATLEQGYTATIPAFRDVDDVLENALGFIWRANEQFDGVSGSLYDDGVWATITNKELTSNVATLESVAHPFVPGQTIIIADVGAPFNGTFQITATTDDTFSYIVIYTNVASTPCSGMGVVNANNLDFVGWFNREDDPLQADPTYSVISTARMTFTGVGPRLARLTAQLLAIVNNATPTRWGDIKNLTPWRAMWHFWSRYTTVTTLCDVSFSDTTDTFLFSELSTQGRNALLAVQEIAQQINANVEFAPWGALSVNRDANYLTAIERSALSVVGSWGRSDASGASRSIDPNPDTGKVDSVGAFLNTATSAVKAFTARAPGHAQGEGQADDTIAAQVLAASNNPTAALDELRDRVGSRFNLVNLREFLDVKHTGNFAGLPIIPSRSQYHWWTLQNVGGPNNVNRISYTTTVWWTVDSVTMEYNAKGVFNVRARYRRLCDVGDPGDDTTTSLPAPGQTSAIPDLGFDAFPFQLPEVSFPDTGLALNQINPVKLLPPSTSSGTQLVKTDGDTLLAWSSARLELVQNLIALRYPQTREINPPTLGDYQHQMALFDPANKGLSSGNNKAYDLASDGNDSRVFQAVTVFAPIPLYLTGDTFSGKYTVLRTTSVSGSLMVYTPDDASVTTPFDFAASDGGFVASPAGVYVAGSGWQCADRLDGDSVWRRYVIISKNIATNGVLSIQVTYDLNKGHIRSNELALGVDPPGYSEYINDLSDGSGQVFIQTYPGTNLTTINILLLCSSGDTQAELSGSGTITFLRVESSPGGGANVRVLTDGGITPGSTVSVGTSPGTVGGFDTQRAGPVSYTSCAAKVRKATTLGGAYSDHTAYTGANPVCIVIPWYLWGTNSLASLNTSNANPDYITALDQVDSDGGTLYLVDGTTAVKTNVTPVAGMTFDNANCITTMYGTHIAVIGLVGGVYKLYTSPDTGVTWTLAATLGTATMIHNRRGDTRAFTDTTGIAGQLFVCDGDIEYSSKFGSAGVFPRTLPITALGVDVLG